MNVAIGWRFYSADFSCNATDPKGMKHGSVRLVRDPTQKAAWHSLNEDEKESTPLFVSGNGVDFHSALQNANASAMMYGNLTGVD